MIIFIVILVVIIANLGQYSEQVRTERREAKTEYIGRVGEESGFAGCLFCHSDVIANQIAHEVNKRAEHDEYPEHSEEVEEHVRKGRPSCLGSSRECNNIRCNGGTDVLSHNECDALIYGQHAA